MNGEPGREEELQPAETGAEGGRIPHPRESAAAAAQDPRASGTTARLMSLGGTLLGLILLVVALWIFGRTVQRYDMAEVVTRFGQIPGSRIAMAILFVVLSYGTQASYDYLSAVSVGLGISPARAGLAAFIGNAFTNNIGFSLVTGTSLRYRYYTAWGYSTLEIAQVIALAKLAFFNGLLLFSGITQILDPVRLPDSIHLPFFSPRMLGWLLVLPPALLLIWNGMSRGSILSLGKLRLVRPTQTLLVLQMVAASVQFGFAACTFYFLLPAEALEAAGFRGPVTFLGAYMAVKFIVMFFPVPGNLGVFEGTAIAVLTPSLPAYPVLGALLAYRLLYYVLPFGVALCTLMGYELAARKGFLATMLRRRRARSAA